ncbi:MAG TPA: hypothetical protein H9874_08085 [Candidatus Bilophila faecipullorum]|uniref:DUF945 domain-containing protein n=2 Tax=Bilophila TaxID=35832 RepID=A0A9D1R2U7_9BACT|nr:hypothetical protein [uncultured Bilophila sp.]HIW79087.1 hypothetical protein [Candidatus Bilophila faecipullorum]
MALSRLQKGMIGLGAALVAVIIVGYAGMRYIENAVVETIRTWAAQTPPDARVEVGDVSYKLMEGHLAVKDVRFAYAKAVQPPLTVAIEQIDVLQPGETFFSVLRDPQTEVKETRLKVAESVRLRGISMGPTPTVVMGERVISGIQMDAAALKKLLAAVASNDIPQAAIQFSYGVSYESDVTKDISASVKGLPYAVTMKESRQTGYAEGHLRSSTVTGTAFRMDDKLGNKDVLSIAEIAMENMNLPPQDITLKFIDPQWLEKTSVDGQALEMMRLFSGPKPLLGSFVVRDLRVDTGLATVSLAKMTYINGSTSPFAADFSLEHLKMPTTLAPELQTLSLMDLRDIDVSATLSFSLPTADGAFNISSSLNVADLGTADALFKGTLPQEVLKEAFLMGARSDSLEEEEHANQLIQQNIRFSRLELGYADEGLLPRLSLLGQKLMGLAPQQSMLMVRQHIQQALDLTPEDPDMQRINTFIAKPGAIRFIFSPEKPMSLKEIETLPENTPTITLDVTPGPQTLQELTNALAQ